jgi:hypothetical protein
VTVLNSGLSGDTTRVTGNGPEQSKNVFLIVSLIVVQNVAKNGPKMFSPLDAKERGSIEKIPEIPRKKL